MSDEAGAWEAGAEAWVELVRDPHHIVHQRHDAVVRELLPPPAGLALDIGCGEGRWTRALRLAGYDVTGIDRSEALLEAARAVDQEGSYEVGEAEALPVADDAAALVLCVNVLPHVVELDAALAEFARVLAPGGVVVLGLIHPAAEAGTYDEERDELHVSRYFESEPHQIPLGHHHVVHQHRTIEQYVRAVLAAGFTLVDLREIPGPSGSTPRYLDLRGTLPPVA
jgi:ubiquinone/menaquinone biosynthesis C-methylase UbiE